MEFSEVIYIFSSISAAIFLEAMPFLAFGALVSALLEVYFPPERLARFIPKTPAGGFVFGLSAGLLVPTCECGVVPIVRRLISKGVPPYIAVTYMLAAPIINPVVLASTYIAFRGSLSMVAGRVAIAILTATAVGLFVRRSSESLLLKNNGAGALSACGRDHHPGEGLEMAGCGCGCHNVNQPPQSRFRHVLTHAAHEFIDMGYFLILGSFAAAFFKTFAPAGLISIFADNLPLSISGMMLLAIILSICSEADAFVAASFMSFAPAAQLAFVAIGPMVDLKLLGMYAASFRSRLFFALIIIPVIIVFISSLLFGMAVPVRP